MPESSSRGSTAVGVPRAKPREYAVLARISRIALSVGGKLGKLTLGNITTVFALSALVLYIVGVLRRVAQLHDVGISTTRGLPLWPLQDYLVSGLAVVIEPGRVDTILGVTLFATAILATPWALRTVGATDVRPRADSTAKVRRPVWADSAKEQDTPPPSVSEAPDPSGDPAAESSQHDQNRRQAFQKRASKFVEGVLAIGALILVVVGPIAALCLIPWAIWLPFVTVILVAALLVWIGVRYAVVPLKINRWTPRHARIVTLALLGCLLVLILMTNWFNPPPMDRATVETVKGDTVQGPLISQSGGAIQIAVERKDASVEADIVVVPFGRVESVRIGKGSKRYRETLLELVGIHLWRLVPSGDGEWRFEPASASLE